MGVWGGLLEQNSPGIAENRTQHQVGHKRNKKRNTYAKHVVVVCRIEVVVDMKVEVVELTKNSFPAL